MTAHTYRVAIEYVNGRDGSFKDVVSSLSTGMTVVYATSQTASFTLTLYEGDTIFQSTTPAWAIITACIRIHSIVQLDSLAKIAAPTVQSFEGDATAHRDEAAAS